MPDSNDNGVVTAEAIAGTAGGTASVQADTATSNDQPLGLGEGGGDALVAQMERQLLAEEAGGTAPTDEQPTNAVGEPEPSAETDDADADATPEAGDEPNAEDGAFTREDVRRAVDGLIAKGMDADAIESWLRSNPDAAIEFGLQHAQPAAADGANASEQTEPPTGADGTEAGTDGQAQAQPVPASLKDAVAGVEKAITDGRGEGQAIAQLVTTAQREAVAPVVQQMTTVLDRVLTVVQEMEPVYERYQRDTIAATYDALGTDDSLWGQVRERAAALSKDGRSASAAFGLAAAEIMAPTVKANADQATRARDAVRTAGQVQPSGGRSQNLPAPMTEDEIELHRFELAAQGKNADEIRKITDQIPRKGDRDPGRVAQRRTNLAPSR